MPDDEPVVGYADAVQVYWDKGWRGVLPLKRGTKWPPPKGYTGYEGADPSFADILQWSELYPDGNLCLRLPDGIVGIDVDAYGAKTGAAAFTEAVVRWGPLPDGPQSSSRDGDQVSGLRLFRVPPGTLLEDVIVFPERSIGDIEVIQRHHRYVVCWPSVHPEGRSYWWRNAGGQLLGIPEPDGIPDLPPRWLDALKLTPRSLEFTGDAFDTRRALTAGEPSPAVAARLVQAIKELNLPGMSRHDTCCRHVLAILRYGREGQSGVEQALTQLRLVFIAVAGMAPGARTRDEATDEFNRMVTNKNAARELSQPGILDWFKRVMDGRNAPPEGGDPDAQGANMDRADDAGAAAPGAVAVGNAAPEPPDPSNGGELEALEQDFWTVREQHKLIYTAALNRTVSPWAVLGCCVARVLALVPSRITLPPLVGGAGSLNWFVAVTGKPGSGKGAALAVARSLVPGDFVTSSVGSGEGMVECYNRAPTKGDDPPSPVDSVMFEIEEVDTLAAMMNRSGQTTLSILKNGFSGERLGNAYRGRRDAVLALTYRMTVVALVQPSRAGVLLDDGGGGTPQRFMWFPAGDRRISRDRLPWPVDNLGRARDLTSDFPQSYQVVNVSQVVIPTEVADEIVDARVARANGSDDDDDEDLDGQALFSREKLAFALAYMDGRVEVDLEDWRLSGIVASVSDWWRARTAGKYRSSKMDESRERGQLRGVEAAYAEAGKTQEQIRRVTRVYDNVVDKVKRSMPVGITTGELNRRIAARDRDLLQTALEYAVSQGSVRQLEGTNTWVTR